jgi:hypothetical protein
MKRLFSLAGLTFIFLALITGGCEKPLDEAIIGKWEVQFQKIQGFSGETMVVEEIDTMETNEMVIEIIDDGTGKTWKFDELDSEFTWVLEGTMTTVTVAGDTPQVMEFETTIKKKTLTLVWTVTQTKSKAEIDKMKMIIIAHRVD